MQRFNDSKVGWWGVIDIQPSSETHVFRKEYSDQKLIIRRGDVYVRDGDSITVADKSGHDRLQRRKFQSTIDEFKSEIKTLKQEIKEPKFYAEKPTEPKSWSLYNDWLSRAIDIPRITLDTVPQLSTKPNFGGPSISYGDKWIEIKYWTEKLLHRHTHYFNPIYLLSQINDIDINLHYSIYSENMIGVSKGTLLLKIRPQK